MENDPLTEKIIACCYDVHRELGPGLNEKIYGKALMIALRDKGLDYEKERSFKVNYKGKDVGLLRLDLVVDGRVVVELKAVSGYVPKIFEQQLIAYLKASGLKVGLLVNFGNNSCKVRRFVN